ncbi:MAG TPA: family 10 glycosylhydrolase [Chitinophagaceae bacterium]|nr:family 10 glycosylhydrolase [Chitinophagaceae bacterium]
MKNLILFLCCIAAAFSTLAQPSYEFRGVWIATVDNIDWPPRNNFNVESQKADYIRQLELHKKNGLNAVIVQVRPAADAFYPSQIEPWSQWLTGLQGKAPEPFYDPLKFMIEEAHKRGFEFHAWCNPYRANFNIARTTIAPGHVTRRFPEWFLTYGNTMYFDPGNKQAQQWVVNVIKDIVSRYDIDALHMDDYFYPYRIPGKEFPDTASFRLYANGRSKDQWRRSNTDTIIQQLSVAIKEQKPWCKFGISPFGVWRNSSKDPRGSATRAGVSNYDDLYADILLWLQKKWIDYIAPQIYWEFSQPNAPYGVLLDWWSKNSYGRHCYIGLGIYKAGTTKAWKDSTLIPRQIDSLRTKPNVQGAIFFSSASFNKNPLGWNDSLQKNQFKSPALIPRMEWIDSILPLAPVVSVTSESRNGITLELKQAQGSRPTKTFLLYKFEDGQPVKKNPGNLYKVIAAGSQETVILPYHEIKRSTLAVSCIDLVNNESELTLVLTNNK